MRAAVDQVVAGGEPMRVENHQHGGPRGIDLLAQAIVSGNEIGVRAVSLQDTKLFALHQTRVMRYDRRAGDLSHGLPLYVKRESKPLLSFE